MIKYASQALFLLKPQQEYTMTHFIFLNTISIFFKNQTADVKLSSTYAQQGFSVIQSALTPRPIPRQFL